MTLLDEKSLSGKEQESISPTFFEQLFHTNVIHT
jgi:hypothetical protein